MHNNLPQNKKIYNLEFYQKVLDFVVASGNRLAEMAKNIEEINLTKIDTTEEDSVIERGLKQLVGAYNAQAAVYAEEENQVFENSTDLWVIDPISGTSTFIKGMPHYAIAVCHLLNHKPNFAVVYDPSVKELYTAYAGKGAFLNGQQIKVSSKTQNIIVRQSGTWEDPKMIEQVLSLLSEKKLQLNDYSYAVNYCNVASGKADGIIAFTKDSFPEYAGQLVIKEAGGKFTNVNGKEQIQPTDKVFVGGSLAAYSELFTLIQKVPYENCI